MTKKIFIGVVVVCFAVGFVLTQEHKEIQHAKEQHKEHAEKHHDMHAKHKEGAHHMEHGDPHSILMHLPGLTDAQKESLKKIHLELAKEARPVQGKLMECKVQLHNLSTADSVDINAVNSKIDEIGRRMVDLMKKHEMARQKIRALLTEEQRLMFDKHSGHGHDHFGLHHH